MNIVGEYIKLNDELCKLFNIPYKPFPFSLLVKEFSDDGFYICGTYYLSGNGRFISTINIKLTEEQLIIALNNKKNNNISNFRWMR